MNKKDNNKKNNSTSEITVAEIQETVLLSQAKPIRDSDPPTIQEVSALVEPLRYNENLPPEIEGCVYDEVVSMVKSVISSVMGWIDGIRVARQFYDRNPSVITGSRRREAEQKASPQIRRAIEVIRGHYPDYADRLTKEKYDEIVDVALKGCLEGVADLFIEDGGNHG